MDNAVKRELVRIYCENSLNIVCFCRENQKIFALVYYIKAPLIIPSARRKSYPCCSLIAGDDIKTLQENLGHYSSAFTLDKYGHVVDSMKKASADRMQAFIESLHKA